MKSEHPARSASKRDYWKHIISEWECSGCKMQAAFCQQAGVSIKSFSRWRSVFAREQLQSQPQESMGSDPNGANLSLFSLYKASINQVSKHA